MGELMAYAAEKGFTLTEADFEKPEEDEKLSFDDGGTRHPP